MNIYKKFKRHIHFTGSAGLYHYQLGVANIIAQEFPEGLKTTFITGSSGCSLPAILTRLYPNITFTEVLENTTKKILNDCSKSWTGIYFNYQYYSDLYSKIMSQQYFNKYKHPIVNDVNNSVGIFVTMKKNNNFIFNINNYDTRMFSNWEDENDFLSCFTSSYFVPIYHRNKLMTKYKNTKCFDGSLFYNDNLLLKIKSEIKGPQLLICPFCGVNFRILIILYLQIIIITLIYFS